MNAEELLEKYAAGERIFQKLNLSGIDLKGAKLNEISFYRTNLTGTDLSEAILTTIRAESPPIAP